MDDRKNDDPLSAFSLSELQRLYEMRKRVRGVPVMIDTDTGTRTFWAKDVQVSLEVKPRNLPPSSRP